MKNISIIVLFFLFGTGAMANGVDKEYGAFTQHIEEAIQLNSVRLPMYAHLTNGKSVKLSKKLIRYQKYVLFVAHNLDKQASPFQNQGVPVLQDEFISIQFVPTFENVYSDSVLFIQPSLMMNTSALKKKLKLATKTGDWETIQQLCQLELTKLEETPRFYCMYRQLIEAICRAAELAPKHIEKATSVGWVSPEGLSKKLIRVEIAALARVQKLDIQAIPIQVTGIPFLFQDLPEIDNVVSPKLDYTIEANID